MKNMNIRRKMFTGFAIVTAIGLMLGAAGIASILTIRSISEEISKLQAENIGVISVINAHAAWRQSLTEAVLTGADFTGSLDSDTCSLGVWLHSDKAQNISDPVVLDLLRRIDEPHHFIHSEAAAITRHIQAGRLDEARKELVEVLLPRTQEVISLLLEIGERYDTIIEDKHHEIIHLENFAIYILATLVIFAALLSVLLARYISNLISNPLAYLTGFMHKASSTGDCALTAENLEEIKEMTVGRDEVSQCIAACNAFILRINEVSDAMKDIANNDLRVSLPLLSDADTMGSSLSHMVDNLNNMFSEIHLTSTQVSSGAQQIADGAQSLAQGATEQAAIVEELSASASEIANITKINAEKANKASVLAEAIKGNAEKGSRHMNEMVTAVNEINQASENISKVIKVIDDIAFQTNILALNAAVEAARAGQHGKGFAVVADEVRTLAAKSAEAAKDTGNLISNSIEKAECGARIARDTAASLAEIVSGINESSEIVSDIADSSARQSRDIAQINVGIEQVESVVQQNSAIAEESAAASEELSGQSAILENSISQFKLRNNSTSGSNQLQAMMPAAKRPTGSRNKAFAISN